MISRLATPLIFALILTCSVAAQYGPDESEMALTRNLILRAQRLSNDENTLSLVKEARRYYEEAQLRLGARDRSEALALLSLAEIKALNALSLSETNENQRAIAGLRDELERLKALHRERKSELASNTARLKPFKDRESVAKEILRSKAINSIESAEEKIGEAHEAAADELAPELYSKALEQLEESNRNFHSGDFKASLELSSSALSYAVKAYDASHRRLNFKRILAPELSSIYGVQVEETRLGLKLLLNGVFSTKGDKVLFDAHPALDAIIEILNAHPEPMLSLLAYSGAHKSHRRNLSLAAKRAENLYNYLLAGGIAKERLTKAEGTAPDNGAGTASKGAEVELSITAPLQPPPPPASKEPGAAADPEGKKKYQRAGLTPM